MKNIPLLLLAALIATPSFAEAKKRPLPTYAHAVRCAGLTGAWMREVPEASEEGLKRFDRALFWGLAASEVARRNKLTAARMEADTQGSVARAQSEFGGAGPVAEAARRELGACVAEVPPIRRKR
ncbi:MAG TPA: hypothetical protein VGB59_05695 [Allosphingosinicella sp.]|jgi:hypothetical protein